MLNFDFVVVGSGCSGVHAAQTLLAKGAKLLMLDVGIQPTSGTKLIPDQDFVSLRKNDTDQHEYFLGKKFEAVEKSWSKDKTRLTPLLSFIRQTAKEQVALTGEWKSSFMESHARGGLGNAWGRGAYAFTDEELKKVGLETTITKSDYENIISRIGVYGKGKISMGELSGTDANLQLDKSITQLWNKFYKKQKTWNARGMFLERTPLAMSLKKINTDQRYHDMDFWSLKKTEGYHPSVTLHLLNRNPNFFYWDNALVKSFDEKGDNVQVNFFNTQSKTNEMVACRKLILCASVLGTARIVLQSFQAYEKKLSLLCNPFVYTSWLNLGMLGTQNSVKKSSYSQVSLFFKPNGISDFHLMNMYTYRSLLLNKLIREIPLGFRLAYQLISMFKEALVFGGMHLPEVLHPNNTVQLIRKKNKVLDTSLKIDYRDDHTNVDRSLAFIKRKMLGLGCVALITKKVPPGSSKHYGGTLPFSNHNIPFTLNPKGRLNGTKNIYVGDASGFRFLPSKGLTLTIMTNAHRVALNAAG
ncbi:MAG: GMC oxidoreductase [Bacteroidota bacterium]